MAMSGCAKQSPTVHFVLPDGYRGAFAIQKGQSDGIVLEQRNNVYVCRIPACGLLKVKAEKPFSDWHGLTASFDSGETIPIVWDKKNHPPNQVAVWLGDARNTTTYYFIGTKEEATNFYKATAAAPVKLGGISKQR
jgi:hypothetical protein